MTNNEKEYYYNLPLASFTFKAKENKENDNFEIYDNKNINGLEDLNNNKENQNNESNNNNSFDFSNNIESNDSYIKVIIILLYKLKEIKEFINNNNSKNNEIIELLKEIFNNIDNNENINIIKLKTYLNSAYSNRRKFLYNNNDDPCDLFYIIINSFHSMNENDNLNCDLKNNLCLFHKNFWIDLKKNTQFESGSRNEFYFSYNHFIFEMNIDKILNLIKNINNKDKILGKIFLYEKILFENNNEKFENNNIFNGYSNRIIKNLYLLNEPTYFYMNVFSKNVINNNFDNLKLFLLFPKIFNINSFFICNKKINYKFYGIILIKNLNSFVILIKIKNLFVLFDEYYKIKFENYFDFLTYSIKNNLIMYLYLYKKTKKIINDNNKNYENFEDVSNENILKLEKWIEYNNNKNFDNFIYNKLRNEENILNCINIENNNNSYFPKNKLNKIEKNNNTQHINSLSNLSSFNNNNINNTQDNYLNNAYKNHINKSLSNELNYSNKTKINKANSFIKQKLNKKIKQKIPNNYNKFLKSPEKKSLSGRNLKRYSKSNLNDIKFINNNNNNNSNNIINKSIDVKHNKIDYLNKNYDLPRPFVNNFEKDNKSNFNSPNKQNIKTNKSMSNFVSNTKNNYNNQHKNKNNENSNKNQKVLSLNAIRKFNTNLHKKYEVNKNIKNSHQFWLCPNCNSNNLIQNYRCKNCRFTIKNFESYSKLYLTNHKKYI